MTETTAVVNTRTRTLPPRDARGRFVARLGAARARSLPRADTRGRVRVLPSRDAHGRFVAFPTTSAPSWYVLGTDSYRIPGEVDVQSIHVIGRRAPQPLPVARVVRRKRPAMRRAELVNWIVMLIFLVVVYWYGLSLPRPHH